MFVVVVILVRKPKPRLKKKHFQVNRYLILRKSVTTTIPSPVPNCLILDMTEALILRKLSV